MTAEQVQIEFFTLIDVLNSPGCQAKKPSNVCSFSPNLELVNGLTQQFCRTIAERRLFKSRQRILVAVSGGLDSMVLLHLMHAAAPRNGWKLTVAHLNHRLRGRSSEADARLVGRTAMAFGLPAVIGNKDVAEVARHEKLSLEMAARKARHQFLAQTAARLKVRTIALAHHANDQLELFFLRLLRGSGSQGLRGMQWRSPSPFDKRIELVRPLLGEMRATLAGYAAENRVRFREDASNECIEFQRNRVRHELLPLLREHYQPALEAVVSRVLDITTAEADFVGEAARGWLAQMPRVKCGVRSGREGFEDLALAVQRRVLQLELLTHGIVPDFELIEQLRLNANRPVCVSPAKRPGLKAARPFFVIRDLQGIVAEQRRQTSVVPGGQKLVELDAVSGETSFDGIQVGWKLVHGRKWPFRAGKAGSEWFDADRVGNRILLRHWQAGDRFQPIGMKSEVKLQDFFVNQKVPRRRRHELVLGVSATGEVFWIEGMRISERFKLTNATNRRLQWRWQRL